MAWHGIHSGMGSGGELVARSQLMHCRTKAKVRGWLPKFK